MENRNSQKDLETDALQVHAGAGGTMQERVGDADTPLAQSVPQTFTKEAAMKQADQWDVSLRGEKMSSALGRVIYKYQMPVQEHFTMMLPAGAEILRVQDFGGMFWMWAMVRTDVPDEPRHFHAFKTGGAIPDDLNIRYVGCCAVFIQMELMLYIFEDMGK